MIQIKNVVDELYGLVGWRNDFSDDIRVSSSLTNSESGLYYQDAHPLLTLKTLKSIAPDFSNRKWEEYSNSKAYNSGDVVALYDENDSYGLYVCTKDGTVGENPAEGEDWEGVDPFSTWLEEKTKASISNAVSKFVNSVMPSGGTKTLLEHRLLFNSVSRLSDRVKNVGSIVGLEVNPIHANDVAIKLHRIGLQAIKQNNLEELASVRMLVKSSNDMLGNVASKDLNVGGYSTKWLDLNSVIYNKDGGQSIYLCYSQNDLASNGMEAVNRTIDWSKKPCSVCNSADYQAYLAWSKYIEVWPFYVASENIINLGEGRISFDQQDMIYVNMTNYGINLDMSVYCDYTDFIIRNKYEFVKLIMKQLAVDMLREFVYNPNVRANRNSVNASRTDVIVALDGTGEKHGIIAELDEMYKGLNVSMKGIGKVCRPCANGGLRYTTT